MHFLVGIPQQLGYVLFIASYQVVQMSLYAILGVVTFDHLIWCLLGSPTVKLLSSFV